MSIEKITSKIIADAEGIAKQALDQATSQSDDIIAGAKKKAESIIEDAKIRGEKEKKLLIGRRESVADIDGRKMLLTHKQELISECFDKAVDKIVSMDEADYIAFLSDTLKSTGIPGGQLMLNAKDKSGIGSKLLDRISKDIPDGKFTLSEEEADIRGGAILKDGQVFVNMSVEALIEDARENLSQDVANLLFDA